MTNMMMGAILIDYRRLPIGVNLLGTVDATRSGDSVQSGDLGEAQTVTEVLTPRTSSQTTYASYCMTCVGRRSRRGAWRNEGKCVE